MDKTQPLGLPKGSIRAIMTLAVTLVTLYLFATGQVVPTELLVVNTLIMGNYFGARGKGDEVDAVTRALQPEPLAAPYIPGEQDS
jgi:hypothetical protein